MMVLLSDRNGLKSPLDYFLDTVKECSFAYYGNMVDFGVCQFSPDLHNSQIKSMFTIVNVL